jgi:hypothetical protein
MADDDYDQDLLDSDAQPADLSPRDLRVQLKEANARAKEADNLRAENLRLKNEVVIRDAGLTLNDRQKAALQAVHTGDWTPDALKQSATELGFITAPVVPDDPSLALTDQLSQASAGTDAPIAARDAEIDKQLDGAQSEAEFLAMYRNSGRPISL